MDSTSPLAVMPPRYPLVIFDFDGTLANTEAWFLGIANDLALTFGFRQVDDGEIAMLRGRTSKEVIKYLGIPSWKLPRIARHIHRQLAANVDAVVLFPGVREMVADLRRAGVRLAIVSSNSESNVRAILGPDLTAQFECFECGSSLFGKARRYKAVRKGAGMKKRDVLSVGDETRDITAAKKEEIACGAVLWGAANRDILSAMEPDMLFSSPAEVVAHVLGRDEAPSGGRASAAA